jgi:hypothetical protein
MSATVGLSPSATDGKYSRAGWKISEIVFSARSALLGRLDKSSR